MKSESSSGSSDVTVDAVIADYLQAAERGEAVDRRRWIERHPEHAGALESFFAGQDRLEQVAPALGGAARPNEAILSGSANPNDVTTDSVLHDAPDPMPGEFVRYFGDYELVQEIARGGMGVVYEAKQLSLNRSVALKMILAGQLASDGEVARFQQEAEAAAGLDHPHIVPIYEVGQYKGRHYFTMKLIEGGPLSEHVARLKGDTRAAATLMVKVARAVHFAHQRGILHRDLKPANVLLDAAGDPHVTDFGLAKRVDADMGITLSGPGGAIGTPAYMPPEQARGDKHLTTAADIYSLGAILYVLLTGEPPFRAKTPLDTMRKVIDEEPSSPRTLNGAVPADLETICLKCLEKDPAKRFATAADLSDDLDRWLRHEPIRSRPVTTTERVGKWIRRHPAAATSAAAMIVLASGMVIAGVAAWRNAEERAAAVHDLDAARGELRGIQSEVGEKSAMLASRQAELAESQKNLANVWDSIKVARESLEDSKSRLLFEQARAARMAGKPGWRDQAQSLLKDAEHLRARPRAAVPPSTPHVAAGAPLPDIAELRSEAAAVLISRDARVVSTLSTMPGLGTPGGMSADGKTVITPWMDVDTLNEMARAGPNNLPKGGLRVLDTVQGKEVARFGDLSHIGMFRGASIVSPDGKRYLHMTADEIRMYSVPDGKPAGAIKTPKSAAGKPLIAYKLAFRGDGQELAGLCAENPSADHEAHLVVWSLPDPQPRAIGKFNFKYTGMGVTLDYNRNGDRLLVATAADKLALVNPADGAIVSQITPGQTIMGQAILSPQGWLAWLPLPAKKPGDMFGRSGVENVLWNVESNTLHRSLTTMSSIAALNNGAAFHPNGMEVAVADGNDGIAFFETYTGRHLWTLRGAQRGLQHIKWCEDGRHLVVGGFDGGLRRWELSEEIPLRTMMPGVTAQAAAVSPDGRWIAVLESLAQDDAPVHLIDTRSGNVRLIKGGGLPSFSPDGKRVGFARFLPQSRLSAFDAETGKEVASFTADKDRPLLNLASAGFTADGKLVAIRNPKAAANVLEVLDVENNKVIATIDNANDSLTAIFTGDGRTVIRGLRQGKSVVAEAWDWVDGKAVNRLALPEGAMPIHLRVSADRKTLLVVALLMDFGSGKRIYEGSSQLASLAGSQMIALIGRADSPTPIALPVDGFVSGAAVSPDNQHVAVLERGGRLALYRASDGGVLLSSQIPDIGDAQVEFSHDGKGLLLIQSGQPLRALNLGDLRLGLQTLGLDW